MRYLFLVLLFLSALFLILLVLVQRGKGGGLAGAFGGLGGQSAFGTKAGDAFTRITIGAAAVWILLCILSVKMLGTGEDRLQLGGKTDGLIPTTTGQPPAPEEGAQGAGEGAVAPSSPDAAPAEDPGDDAS